MRKAVLNMLFHIEMTSTFPLYDQLVFQFRIAWDMFTDVDIWLLNSPLIKDTSKPNNAVTLNFETFIH